MIPVFNDWAVLRLVLPQIEQALAAADVPAEIIVVDDGSSDRVESADVVAKPEALQAVQRIDVLRLRRNLGHQRAIAIGLAWIERRRPAGAVVVMDSDGQDAPTDVPRLLAACAEADWEPVVFAERTRRAESFSFVVLYHLYRLLHAILTGRGVRMGNFSVVPRRRLSSLSVTGELWNHYAAGVIRSRQPVKFLSTNRSPRLVGEGTMNLTSLVIHGLSGLSVWSDVIGVRLLIAAVGLITFSFLTLVGVVLVRLLTPFYVPGWATAAAGLSAVILLQALTFAALFILTILGGRQAPSFLPRRDHKHYVAGVRPLHPVTEGG